MSKNCIATSSWTIKTFMKPTRMKPIKTDKRTEEVIREQDKGECRS